MSYFDHYLATQPNPELNLDAGGPTAALEATVRESAPIIVQAEPPATGFTPQLGKDLAPEAGRAQPQLTATQRRVSLQLSASLHRQVKLVALEEEETLNSLIVRLLRRYVQERNSALEAQQKLRRRLGP